MKKLLAIVVVLGGLGLVPAMSHAAEPVRDRAAEATDVTAMLGLAGPEVRVLSESEAQEVRGTGGCLPCGCGLLGLNVNARVKANVNVLGAVKVKANANVHVGIRL